MTKELSAMVSGHICLDITPVMDSSIQKSLNEILTPGALATVSGVNLALGGAVWNVGISLSKLGISTSLNGRIATDEFGAIIEKIIDDNNVNCNLAKKEKGLTSYTVIISVAGSDRIFLHAPGANNEFTSKDVPFDRIKEVDLFHFGYPPVMRNMYLNDGIELIKIFRKVKEAGTTTSLDMAMPDPHSESGSVDWNVILQRVLPFVDIYTPSIEETLFMVDRPQYLKLKDKAAGGDMITVLDLNILESVAQKLHNWGAKAVLLKCGFKGCFVSTVQLDKSFGKACPEDIENWSNKCIFEPCFQVNNVVSTTGAGDATIAGFLASLLQGYSIESAMHNATAVGALCVGTQDAISGIIPLSDVVNIVNDGGMKKCSI